MLKFDCEQLHTCNELMNWSWCIKYCLWWHASS